MVRMISSMGRGHFRFVAGGASALSFTPAWGNIQTSGGGAIISVHPYPDGTVIAAGDTFGPWIHELTGSVTTDGTTFTAPAWRPLMTSTSLPSANRTYFTSDSQTTTAWAVAAAPSNTNVIYSFLGNGLVGTQSSLFVTNDRGGSWVDTGITETFQPNGNFCPNDAMAVDPINPDVVYLITRSTGVRKTATGTGGGGWSLISTATLPAANGNSGCVVFDSSAGTTSGKTNRILVCINGSGMYESTNAGSSWTLRNAGSPPPGFYHVSVDSFGQVWVTDGFLGSGTAIIYKYASSTWTTASITGISRPNDGIVSVFQDPLYAGLVANNQVLAFTNNQGIGYGSTNNGTSFASQAAVPTLVAPPPQAAWLNSVNYYDSGGPSGGTPYLNLGKAAPDLLTPGKIWGGLGIDMVSTPKLFTGSTLSNSTQWTFDSIGLDQMVAIQIIPVPNSKPMLGVWDRGIFCIENPDSMQAQTQFPNSVNFSSYASINWAQILMAWSLDFGYGTFTAFGVLAWGGNQVFAKSTDGGHTWAAATQPTGMIEGSVCAMATPPSAGVQHVVCIPNQGTIQYSTNGGTTWANSTIVGSFSYPVTSYNARRYPLTADRSNADTFYFMDQAASPKVFKSTDGGANWAVTGGTISTTGFAAGVGADRLYSVPPLGGINTSGHLFYQPTNGKLVWSHDGGVTWPFNSGTLDAVVAMGIGGLKPGGTYPALYARQTENGTLPRGIYCSLDSGTTWSLINTPASEQVFPNHVFDICVWLWGDWNVYGRVYCGYMGSTACYIDTSDALPYVNFTVATAKPNQNFTGTVTITAEHSGLVPVSSVQFSVDGANISAPLTGQSTYSVSWNTAGVAHGAHTLTVTTTGANGQASFAIPITTS